VQFFQLYVPSYFLILVSFTKELRRYVNKDRAMTKRIVQQAEKRGIQALFITVDAPQLGRREKVGSFVVSHA
jgi:isopentenyl diphosphate isomerase/L-lactate dehydrogenase-like FMN-dependent dehydrogenase